MIYTLVLSRLFLSFSVLGPRSNLFSFFGNGDAPEVIYWLGQFLIGIRQLYYVTSTRALLGGKLVALARAHSARCARVSDGGYTPA